MSSALIDPARDPSVCPWRVLLVDDNLDDQRLLRRILTSANVDRNSDSSTFDLILMDLRMPVLDGCEATRELRLGGYSGAIAIVTAFDDPSVREAAFDAGCDEFLTKPVPRSDLLDVVQKYAVASAK
jgi:CheY-like chemotaxis protein